MSPADPTGSRPGATRRLLGSEIGMVFRRRRNQVLLFVVSLAPLAIGIAVKASPPAPGADGPQFLNQVSSNGLFLVFTGLTVTVPVLIPLLVGVVAGDSIAGEAGTGTLRYLLTVPVGRGRLLLAKAMGTMAFLLATVLSVAVVGLIAGAGFFGLHPAVLLSGQTVSLADGLLRTAEVAAFVILTLTGYVAIGMFISTLTEVPIAAMAATVGVAIVANVLDQVPQLGSIRDGLFVHHWLGFAELLRGYVDWGQLGSYLLLQLAYVALFGALAWARFTTSDITS
jgi:ABC-2 type transport system permease protein